MTDDTPNREDAPALVAVERTTPSLRRRRGRSATTVQGVVAIVDRREVTILDVEPREGGMVGRILASKVPAIGDENDDTEAIVAAILAAYDDALAEIEKGKRTLAIMLRGGILSVGLRHCPNLPPRQLKKLLTFQESSDGRDALSYRVVGPSSDGQHDGLGVQISRVPKRLIEGLAALTSRAGGRVIRIATRPVGGWAQAREETDPANIAGELILVEIGGSRLRLSFVRSDALLLSRSVEVEGLDDDQLATRIITEVQRTNIFVAGRFRVPTSARIHVLSADADLLARLEALLTIRSSIEIRTSLFRFRILGGGEIPPGTADAIALLSSERLLDRLGAMSFNVPYARFAKALWFAVPLVVILAVPTARWIQEKEAGARIRHQTLTYERTQLLQQLHGTVDRTEELTVALEERRVTLGEVDAFLTETSPTTDTAPILRQVLSVMPQDVVVDSLRIFETTPVEDDAGRKRRRVELTARGFFTLSEAHPRVEALVAALHDALPIAQCDDTSGRYDPFTARTLSEALYPIEVGFELRESSK